ncbi:Transcriptional regulator of ribosomal biogenesis proteins [Rhizina undulata]
MPAPIDISARPQPHQQKSNLTSQLRAAEGAGLNVHHEPIGARSGSISHGNGIPMSNSRLRRESMVNNDVVDMARSLIGAGGMSWGGVSIGSWIRDDIVMTGTSPFTFQSPSHHSSSYLPKLEAEFCRDFSCCGLHLSSLHDLLRHYEEHHAQQTVPPAMHNDTNSNGSNDASRQQHQQHPQQQNAPGITSPISGMGGIQLGMMRQQQMQRMNQGEQGHGGNGQGKEDLIEDHERDGEITGDMEMDDDMTPPPNHSTPMTPQAHQHIQHPPTPSTLNRPSYQSTPNLPSAQLSSLHQQPSHFSPDSSAPGTPHPMDHGEYSFSHNMGNVQGISGQQNGYGSSHYYNLPGSEDMSLDLCIDEPAKRLLNPGGQGMSGLNQAQLHQLMMNGGGIGSGELARRLREESMMRQAGMHCGMMQQDDKPFRCPVIGCEKAYKNQNGLKYHKAHGHTNQQLHENPDGTFSIVNPETSIPYPGTLGMEKEKPYKCDFCCKRYKNLNGLKYHRSHSAQCGAQPPPTGPQPISGGVVAVAGGVAGENGLNMG